MIPFFSIIVPVYNIRPYLAQCVESILNQPFDDYELLLIDDGACDGSGELCDSYAGGRVRVLHKDNGGLSSARNAGIDAAYGRYLMFVDGDDFLEKGCLRQLHRILCGQDTDILLTQFVYEYENAPSKNSDLPVLSENMTKTEQICALFSAKDAVWQAWRSIVRAELIRRRVLRFDETLTSGEDCDFFRRLMQSTDSIYVCETTAVHYRAERQGSLMQQMRPRCFQSITEAYVRWFAYLDELPGGTLPARRAMADRFFYLMLANGASAPETLDTAQEHLFLLEDVSGRKKRIIVTLMKRLGAERILRWLNKL